MTTAWLIARRELSGYFRTFSGYIIAAAVLFIDGLLFNAFAMGGQANRLSTEVLSQFFYFSSGTTMIASLFLSMRLFAEERQTGTFVLLAASPASGRSIVFGKYLSALIFLSLMTLATVFMPLLILVNGKLALGHVAVGYLGLILLGSATLAIGTLGSALARSQLVAIVVSAGFVVTLIVIWLLSTITDHALGQVFVSLALWGKHFPPFLSGTLNLRDVAYYVLVTYVALYLATQALEAKRWD